jgi:hypothetical protein
MGLACGALGSLNLALAGRLPPPASKNGRRF